MKEELSKRLKKKALDLGADVVGIASNRGFDQSHRRTSVWSLQPQSTIFGAWHT